MKDIKLDTKYKIFQYYLSWVMVILFGTFGILIIIFLASYGKTTSYDVDKKKRILNLTYQKFVYIYGSIITYLLLGILILIIIGII